MRRRSTAANIARRGRREERIGADPICYRCGQKEFWSLLGFSARLLEEHHVDGRRRNKTFTVTVCRNCHAVLHALLLDAGVTMKKITDPDELKRQTERARLALLKDLVEVWEADLEEQARPVRSTREGGEAE